MLALCHPEMLLKRFLKRPIFTLAIEIHEHISTQSFPPNSHTPVDISELLLQNTVISTEKAHLVISLHYPRE